jgi:hypothetical protein
MSPKAKSLPTSKELVEDSSCMKLPEPILDINLKRYPDKPTPSSPEWNDYVLSLLTEEEWGEKGGKKHPITDGLRRVADLLYPDVDLETSVVQAPGSHNGYVAVCECLISYENGPDYRRVREVADASPDNNEQYPFSLYHTAVAGTRAEGRALRKFLRLRKIVTLEEVSGETENNADKMNETQLKILATLGERFNVNVWKFVTTKMKEKEPNKIYNYLNEIPKDRVLDVILPELNKFQSKDASGNMVQVPADLAGYDSNFVTERWKS